MLSVKLAGAGRIDRDDHAGLDLRRHCLVVRLLEIDLEVLGEVSAARDLKCACSCRPDDIELGLRVCCADADVTAGVLDEHRRVAADEAVGIKTKVAVPTRHYAPRPTRVGVAQGEKGLVAGDRQPVLRGDLQFAGRIRRPDADVAVVHQG